MKTSEYLALQRKAMTDGGLTAAEWDRVFKWKAQNKKCPTCGSAVNNDEVPEGVSECVLCGRPFCYLCGDGDHCQECSEHEDRRPLGVEHEG